MDMEEERKVTTRKNKTSNRFSESQSESSDTVTSAMDVDMSAELEEQVEEEVSEEEGSGRGVFGLVEAPVFYPTSKEFADPNTYLEKIRKQVEPFGICRIVPPKEWNKEGWKQQIDPRSFSFATKIQSIHTLQKRDGAYAKFMVKLQYFWTHVALQEVEKVPEIGGLAVDLYRLYTLVASQGGYDAVKEKGLWHDMLVPLHLNPHATSAAFTLSSVYRRFLLPYDHYLSSGGSIPEYSTSTQAMKSDPAEEMCETKPSSHRESSWDGKSVCEDKSCGKKSSLERKPSIGEKRASRRNSSASPSLAPSHSSASHSSASHSSASHHSESHSSASHSTRSHFTRSHTTSSPSRASPSSPSTPSPSTPSPPSPSNILPSNRTTRQSSPGNAPPTSPYRLRTPKRPKYSDDDDDEDDEMEVKTMKQDKKEQDHLENQDHLDNQGATHEDSSKRHELPVDIATFTESTLQSIEKKGNYFGPYGDLEAILSEKDVGSWRKAKANSFVYDQDDSFVLCWYCRKGDNPGSLVLCDTPGCSVGAHLKCMNPPRSRIPSGAYCCPQCSGEQRDEASPLDCTLISPPKYTNGFCMKTVEGEDLPPLELDERLGFGHGFGHKYTLAEFRDMAMQFATFWFAKEGEKANESPSIAETEESMARVRLTRSSSNMRNGAKIASEPMVTSPHTIEKEYWRLVSSGDQMVRVEYGSDVDVSTKGASSGFPLDTSGKTVGRQCPEISRWSSVPDRRCASILSKNDTTYLREHGWNLNSLPYVTMLKYLGESISGVTRPMMYIGMLFSSFCWHTEDNWLYSINYIHTGAPKRWYGVASTDAPKFEKAFREALPELFQVESDLIHQLTTVVHPLALKKRGVQLCTTLQREGEIVVTFPRSYHSGFNCGYNVAESVNFALTNWLEWGLAAANEYRFVRSSVFAHEKLLWQIGLAAFNLSDGKLALAASRQLQLYQSYAKAAIRRLKRLGIVNTFKFTKTHIAVVKDHDGNVVGISEEKDAIDTFTKRASYVVLHDREGFEPEDPQCAVCGYDVFFHRVDCACTSPRIPRCLNHGDVTICHCTNDVKFVSFRYRNSSFKAIQLALQHALRHLKH